MVQSPHRMLFGGTRSDSFVSTDNCSNEPSVAVRNARFFV